ncbi:hypothetical protein [Lapillicoccus jejuensis]|uniref:ABC-2 type transport system permease protein n=1 Tax=Lapillicoccus jejuensis TaxID=402171 RepID=A0A542DZI4_9MICO|nr:hypothetical protein [Lapillicoccus jejuensis]TQJ08466.1 hypothetical protein FB458_1556 [Lapillicoccus jejuensis]
MATLTSLRTPVGVPAGLGRHLLADLRWTFRPPWTWLSGVGANLVLAALWWVVVPFVHHHHGDWGVIVGTYLAGFVLADVTSTNVLGADHERVATALADGVSLRRLLLVKNVSLLLVVAVPLLVTCAAISSEHRHLGDLEVALPLVLFPVLTWLGIGNLLSVALPEPALPLRRRWEQRRRWRTTLRWLLVLGLPYALSLAVDPLRVVPDETVRWLRGGEHAGDLATGAAVLGVGLAFYLVGTALALTWHRVRGVRLSPR